MKPLIVISTLILIGGFAALSSAAVTETALDAKALETDARLIQTRLIGNSNIITLDETRLYEDDAPAAGVPEGYTYTGLEWKESLKKGIVIKKVLMIDNPRTWKGNLLIKAMEVKGNITPLDMSLNGVRFSRPASRFAAPMAKQFIDTAWDRWYYIDLPVGALRKGANEILMWADSDSASWRVLISLEEEYARGSVERPHHPNRSFKSVDGGVRWRDNRLGTTDEVDGEYNIRISLDGYLPRGEYESPVYDAVGGDDILKRLADVQMLTYTADIDTPENTSAEVMIRFGNNPRTTDPSWTEWGSVDPGKRNTVRTNARYYQWRAVLTTSDPLAAPAIRSFAMSAEWQDRSPNTTLGVAAQVVHNGHVARGSYPFGYEDLTHPELARLRNTYHLDRIVEGAQTEFDVFMRLLNWSYRIPVTSDEYSWNWNDVVKYEKDESEPGTARLQGPYDGRRRDAMCLYSNQAFIGALLSLGYQARHINIHSEGVSGHEVSEVWSNEFNKWIYMDATRDYYYFDPETGVPLNELEIHNLVAGQVPRVETWQRPFAPELANTVGAKVGVGMREGDNPASIVENGTHILEIMGYFRIIPRNNFLSQPLPVPVHTGATMWGWDGFLNYYDEKFPKRLEYQIQTCRALDFYEPLNQAELYLAETEEKGVLRVEIDTFTPGGLDAYLFRINGGRWLEQDAPSLTWALASGINTIDARVRNVRGVAGPISTVRVTYNP